MVTWVLFAAFATTSVTAGLIWVLYKVNLPALRRAQEAEARRQGADPPQD